MEIQPRESAQPYSHSYEVISSIDNTELWVLEGNTGAYVYKKSKYGGFYRGSSSLILLSQVRMRPYGDNETQYTAYAYLGLNTINASPGEPRNPSMAIACDLGMMSGSKDNGAWFLYTNVNIGGNILTRKEYLDDPIATSTYFEGSDEFAGNQDVYLYMGAAESGYLYIIAINALTLKTQQAYIYDQRLDPENELTCYMEGTKLVPDAWGPNLPEIRIVSDINSGAYLRNLCWYRSMLYTSILGNNDKSLWGSYNAEISYILAYDNEHAWHTNLSDYYHYDVVGSIVDIHYSPAIR